MPTTLHGWREEGASLLETAKAVLARAKADNRDLTPTEVDTLTRSTDQVKQLDNQIKGKALVDSVMSLGTAEDYPEHPGALFTETAAKDLVTAVKTRSSYRTEVGVKAALTNTVLPTTGQGVEAGLYPQAFPLSTLFRCEQAPGPSIRYYRLGDATADVVAEADTKPDSGVTITPVDVAVSKVATTVRFSDEFADDASFLLAYLQRELSSAVIPKENGRGPGTFGATSGVLMGTGATTRSIDLVADAIAGQEALNGSTPSAVVVNPTVLARIRKAKASTGGDYFVDPLARGPTTLHGVRIVSTPAPAAGTAWVVNGAGVVIYRKGEITRRGRDQRRRLGHQPADHAGGGAFCHRRRSPVDADGTDPYLADLDANPARWPSRACRGRGRTDPAPRSSSTPAARRAARGGGAVPLRCKHVSGSRAPRSTASVRL